MQSHQKRRGNIIERSGVVVGDRQEKTRTVSVQWLSRHPFYGKTVRKRRKFVAHDAENVSKAGDLVVIRQCRPLSRTKRWTVVRIVRQNSGPVQKTGEET